MTYRETKDGITITGISHEGLMDDIQCCAQSTKCKTTFTDYSTKCKVTGSPEQLKKFIKKWTR